MSASRFTGLLGHVSPNGDWGFVSCTRVRRIRGDVPASLDRDVFVHKDSLEFQRKELLVSGMPLTFGVLRTEKGFRATQTRISPRCVGTVALSGKGDGEYGFLSRSSIQFHPEHGGRDSEGGGLPKDDVFIHKSFLPPDEQILFLSGLRVAFYPGLIPDGLNAGKLIARLVTLLTV